MAEIDVQSPSTDDDAPGIPVDQLPEEEVQEDEELDEEATQAGLRVLSAPSLDIDDDAQSLYEEPGARTRLYEDERTENERTKLDEFIAKIRQTAGAQGKIDINRVGPRGISEELKGFLDTVTVEEIEGENIPGWLKDSWGGGEYKLAVRDHLSRFRAHVTVKVAGKPKPTDGHAEAGDGMIGLMREMLGRMEKASGGGGSSDVVRMMEMRMAEEREARKEELAAAQLASKERIEQMRIDGQNQIQMLTTLMAAQKPTTDPLELALRLADTSTKGYQESIKFQQKAMTEAMTSAISTSGEMHSSMVKHVLTTLRSVHDSEADQSFLDKVMAVAGTLAGPAQEAIKSMTNRGAPAPAAPAAAAPRPAPVPPAANLPPPGPRGELPRGYQVPPVEIPAAPDTPDDPATALQQQAINSVMITIERTAVFVQGLGIQLTTDPDVDQAWNELEPYYMALPGKLRTRIEDATSDIPQSDAIDELLPFGEKLLDVFSELAGEPTEGEPIQFTHLRKQIEMIQMAVLADLSRAIWLRDFFDAAPWLEDDDDDEDEDDEDDVPDAEADERPTIASAVKKGEAATPKE